MICDRMSCHTFSRTGRAIEVNSAFLLSLMCNPQPPLIKQKIVLFIQSKNILNRIMSSRIEDNILKAILGLYYLKG